MFPILADLELLGRSVAIHSYGVATFAALVTGLLVSWRNARRLGLDPDHLLLGFLVLMPGILVGAKLLPAWLRGDLTEVLRRVVETVAASPRPLATATAWTTYLLMPGGSSVGAILGGGLGLLAYARYFRLPLADVLDALAPGLALGLPLLRAGCLAAGCCYGSFSALPWAVVYTDARAALAGGVPLGVPLHPSPVYEAGATLALGVLLLRRLRRRACRGEVFALFAIGYGSIRLALAPLRGDARFFPDALAWMAAIAAGLAAHQWLRRQPAEARLGSAG